MKLWLMVLLLVAAVAAGTVEHLPLCPADILCTNCKSGDSGKWTWDEDDDECVKDCFGVCDGDAKLDACNVCGGDGSSCNGGGGCDKDCQTALIAVGSLLLVGLLVGLLLWFILSGSGTTVLVPAPPPAAPTPPTTGQQMWGWPAQHVRHRRR